MAASAGDAHPYPIYNARFRIVFPILDADGDPVAGATGLDSELSQDQGTFADATNEATEIATSSGMYYLDIIATELDNKCTAGIVKSSGKTTPFVLYPQRLPVIRTGTAQAGGASSITLDASASGVDDAYNGCMVNITNNSPANAQGQCRRIIDYNGTTKVATVEGTYGTNPDSTSTFEILLTPEASSVAAWAGTQVATPTVAGVPEVDVTHWLGTAAATPTVAGVPEVDITHLGGAAQSASDLKDFVDDGYDPATNKVQGVALTDTVTTYTGNTPQTGDNFARLGAPAGASVSADVAAVKSDTAGIVLVVITEIADILAAVDTEVAAIKAKTDQLTFTLANKVDSSLQSAASIVAAAANRIADHTIRRTTANVEASSDGDTVGLRSLLGAISQLTHWWAIVAGVMTVFKNDDTTALGTKNVNTTVGADPITSID